MLRLFLSIVALMITIALASAGEMPVKLTITPVDNEVFGSGQRITIQSLVDSITINNISLNRGNCKILAQYGSNTLKFGERKIVATVGCEVAEVKLDTSAGPIIISAE